MDQKIPQHYGNIFCVLLIIQVLLISFIITIIIMKDILETSCHTMYIVVILQNRYYYNK